MVTLSLRHPFASPMRFASDSNAVRPIGRTHKQFRNRSERSFRIQSQKAKRLSLIRIASQQDAVLSIRHPGSSPCFRLLLVKTKSLSSDRGHDFAKQFPNHLSDDRRIIRPCMVDTKLHELASHRKIMLHGRTSAVRTCSTTGDRSSRMLKQFVQQGRRQVETGGVPSGVR